MHLEGVEDNIVYCNEFGKQHVAMQYANLRLTC